MYNDDVSYGNDRGSRSRVSLGKRVAAGVAAGAAVMVPLATFLTTEKTPADKIALSYGGGPFEGNQYQRTVQPGSGLSFNGWNTLSHLEIILSPQINLKVTKKLSMSFKHQIKMVS